RAARRCRGRGRRLRLAGALRQVRGARLPRAGHEGRLGEADLPLALPGRDGGRGRPARARARRLRAERRADDRRRTPRGARHGAGRADRRHQPRSLGLRRGAGAPAGQHHREDHRGLSRQGGGMSRPALKKVSAEPDLLLSTHHSFCPGCEGLQEIIHSAARGEKFTAVLLNNGVFGETGGHMTTTSVLGQRTKTTMDTGRVAEQHGYPIKIADLIAQVDGSAYVARGAMHTPAAIAWSKRILGEAFRVQLEGRGFSFVELLTMCPTDWYVDPIETPDWIEQNFTGTYPLKILKHP